MHYELDLASRQFLSNAFEDDLPISWPNVDFTPPSDGSIWLQYHYIDAVTETVSLDRKCRIYEGIVQVSVIFSPGAGTQKARRLANDVAKSAKDGIMLSLSIGDSEKFIGYITEGGKLSGAVVPHNSGWVQPVRFTVRAESRE